MAAREQLGRALFGLGLRNFTRGGRAKKLRAQAGEVLIALKLPRTRPPSSRLAEEQADTLGALLGHLWGAPFHGGARAGSQAVAQALSEGLRTVWDRALPPGKTLVETLEAAWGRLQAARRADPDLHAGEFLRGELFDPWRSRFMTQLYQDDDLRKRLQLATGLKVDKPAGGTPRFLLELKAGEVPFHVGLDIDHAEQRLAEAVEQALAKGCAAPLRPIVQGSSLQLASPAENRVLFEFLRRRNRVAEQMRASSAARMTAEDEAELMAALERELHALDAWQEWNPPG